MRASDPDWLFPADRLAVARLAARQAGLERALGRLPDGAPPVFARLAGDAASPAPLPVTGLFDEEGELVGPPVPFLHDAAAWRAHHEAVGGHIAERLSTLSRAATYLSPGAPLRPAPPDAPYALAVSPHAVLVNPAYLALLPPSPVELPVAAAVVAVPPLPDESLAACVSRFVDRCRACLTGGGCNPLLSTTSSGADECAAMSADDLRGFRLFCTAGLYERTRACVQQQSPPPPPPGDGGAEADGGTTPTCAPVENAARLGLESFAPLLDDAVCAGRLAACLRPPPGPGGSSCGDGNCGDAPRCRDACGGGCTLANGPLDVACALPCEITGGIGRMFGWRPDPPAPATVRGGQESEVCGGCGSDAPKPAPPARGGAGGGAGSPGGQGGTPPPPETDEGCGSCNSDRGTGSGMGGGPGGSGAGGAVGMGGSGMAGSGAGGGNAGAPGGGSGGTGGKSSGCGSSSSSGSGGSSSSCGSSCNSCGSSASGSSSGGGCSCSGSSGGSSAGGKCSIIASGAANDGRRSRYGAAEPLLALVLPMVSLLWAARRRR